MVLEGEDLSCPLCEAIKNEKILASNEDFVILRTKKMKGHRERIMVVFRVHTDVLLGPSINKGLDLLEKAGKELFKYTTFFVIMEPTYATIKDHWHLVASDLNRNAEDYDQVLITPWKKIVSVYD